VTQLKAGTIGAQFFQHIATHTLVLYYHRRSLWHANLCGGADNHLLSSQYGSATSPVSWHWGSGRPVLWS